jgi:hypothetical protein
MACPYFIPAEIHERELWAHRERLPLGDGFGGRCGAQAPDARCDDETLRLHCNLGYASAGNTGCVHLSGGGAIDAVRFLVQSAGPVILRVQFACECAHQPALCGELRYDQCLKIWLEPPDARLLHLAESAVRAWIARNASEITPATANNTSKARSSKNR